MAGPRLDRVVALGAKIVDLRRQLAACEAELATLLHDRSKKSAGQNTHEPADKRSSGEGSRGTTAKILRLLSAHPRAVFDAAELADDLGANIASVRVMLKRLLDANKIRRTGRGSYRAR